MDMFKKKSLCAALAGIGALGVAGAAQAVNVNGDGLGQVLIYPYYTARNDGAGNAYNSLLTVVNTTNSAKSVKVRFLEGKNSREVLDFNLFLSKHDVWTAAVGASSGGAAVFSSDASCILPNQLPSGGQAFVNFAYSGSNDDGAGNSLDRTMEGYVEIIEMATYASTSTTSINVTHVNGVPPGCAKETDAQAAKDALSPSGGLFGTMSLINVDSGNGYSYNAVALDNYSTLNLYAASGLPQPDLTEAFPPISVVNAENATFQSTWGLGSADPVSAVLMHDNVMNEYVLDASTTSGTDWVVTMPTKRFYVPVAAKATPANNAPFQRNFTATGSCDDVSLSIYDREERTTSTPLNFSPPPPTSTNSICWEANVITFNNTNVLGSTNVANIPVGFSNGWLDLGWTPNSSAIAAHRLVNFNNTVITPLGSAPGAATTVTYVGVPVVGFAAESFVNNGIVVSGSTVLSAYGNTYPHRYTTTIN